jgi:hypothetical protein
MPWHTHTHTQNFRLLSVEPSLCFHSFAVAVQVKMHCGPEIYTTLRCPMGIVRLLENCAFNGEDYCGSGLCSSSGIRNTWKHKVSETASLSIFRRWEEVTYSVVRFEIFTAVTMKKAVFWELLRVTLVRTGISEEPSASHAHLVFLRSVRRLLVGLTLFLFPRFLSPWWWRC